MPRDADYLEELMQDIYLSRLRISVTCDCARNHNDPSCVFLPITHRGCARGFPEALNKPTFCHDGTHPGF
jgi:hypothetical protein